MEMNGLSGSFNNDGTYMEQEEEWEREGLLDPAWEKQQKKVKQNTSVVISSKYRTMSFQLRYNYVFILDVY